MIYTKLDEADFIGLFYDVPFFTDEGLKALYEFLDGLDPNGFAVTVDYVKNTFEEMYYQDLLKECDVDAPEECADWKGYTLEALKDNAAFQEIERRIVAYSTHSVVMTTE
jgi:hypothetical protein